MKTKSICITGIGIALFVVLSMCLRVPLFENYYICLGYVVMTVYLYTVGVTSGTLVGALGTFIYCLLINGLRGMPGWILGNVVIGLSLGVCIKATAKMKDKITRLLFLEIVAITSTALGILYCKSLLESALYSQPILVRVTTNSYAFIADSLTIMASLLLCPLLHKHINKYITSN